VLWAAHDGGRINHGSKGVQKRKTLLVPLTQLRV